MSLDKGQVAHIANLARIDVAPEELDSLQGDLNRILGFVEQLGELDTQGVEPMSSVARLHLRWRADEVTDGGRRDEVLANAPETMEGFFVVPKVVE